MPQRIFDCFLYNGEIDVLRIRLEELSPVVDFFVVVEASWTFSGLPKETKFNSHRPYFSKFAEKIIYIEVTQNDAHWTPWEREAYQRDALYRSHKFAEQSDICLVSDVDEIPSRARVQELATDFPKQHFVGLEMQMSYFALDFVNIEGPEVASVLTFGAEYRLLASRSLNELRFAIRRGEQDFIRYSKSGWHFSYLMDTEQVLGKIRDFSHQEYNNDAFRNQINIARCLKEERDFFNRPGYKWKIISSSHLPVEVRKHRWRHRRFFAKWIIRNSDLGLRKRLSRRLSKLYK